MSFARNPVLSHTHEPRVQALPEEVLVQILEHTRPNAHRSDDEVPVRVADMARYALVCRNWCNVAQRLLFRIVVVPGERTDLLLNILDADQLMKSDRSDSDVRVGAAELAPSILILRGPASLSLWVDKMELQTDPMADSADGGLGLISQILHHTVNLRHFVLHVSILPQGIASNVHFGFQNGGLPSLHRLTHLTAHVFVSHCVVVPQMIAAWPEIRYLDLRGVTPALSNESLEPAIPPPKLRELRVYHSGYRFPISPIGPPPKTQAVVNLLSPDAHAHLPPVERLVIRTYRVPMTDFHPRLLARIKCLVLGFPMFGHSPQSAQLTMPLYAEISAALKQLDKLEELVLLSASTVPVDVLSAISLLDQPDQGDVLHLRVRILGLQWSPKRSVEISQVIARLGTAGGLKWLILWHETWDGRPRDQVIQSFQAFGAAVGLEVQFRPHLDLWDVPIRYN